MSDADEWDEICEECGKTFPCLLDSGVKTCRACNAKEKTAPPPPPPDEALLGSVSGWRAKEIEKEYTHFKAEVSGGKLKIKRRPGVFWPSYFPEELVRRLRAGTSEGNILEASSLCETLQAFISRWSE